MIDSPLDETSGEAKSAYGLFDDDYASYLKVADWDEGGFYPALGKGVTVTFDQPQTLGMVSVADVQDGVPYGPASLTSTTLALGRPSRRTCRCARARTGASTCWRSCLSP